MTISCVEHEVDKGTTQTIDAILAGQRPFAASDYIRRQFRRCYERRLTKLSDAFPVAGELVDLLEHVDPDVADRVLADTAVRTVIQHLRRRMISGPSSPDRTAPLDLCRRLLEETVAYLRGAQTMGPLNLSSNPRVGQDPCYPWIWADKRPADDIFTSAFRFAVESQYDDVPPSPSAAHIEALQNGARLLTELLPSSSKSVLQHTQIVAVIPTAGVWRKMQSSSQYYLGGTIFLSTKILDKPWAVAELLFHESIHQKLYDLQWGHTILKRDSALDPETLPTSSLTVQSPWNYPDNEWDTHRVLAAFHVYVHIVLMCVAAEQRAHELEPVYGPKVGMTGLRAAVERARYLGEKLLTGPSWDELGPAGQRLVQWLWSILDEFDPAPPPAGAYLHLILNRYVREANRVRFRESERIAHHPGPSELSYQADRLLREELDIVDTLLGDMGEQPRIVQLRASAQEWSACAPHLRFAEMRHQIAALLSSCCKDGYSLPQSGTADPNMRVTAMVERSSRLLVAAEQIDELPGPTVLPSPEAADPDRSELPQPLS